MSFILEQFEIGPMQNFIYLIGDEKSKEALVIDPAWEPEKILNLVEKAGYRLAGLAVSHAHYDHTNAIETILKKIDVPVYSNKHEIAYSKSGAGIVGNLGTSVKSMENEDRIRVGETEVVVLSTPGHTPGSQCLQVGNYLITGDTLFIGGCGRTDLPGGDPGALFQSLQKIATLPGDLVICPGHDYGRVKQLSLEEEKKENPYLKMEDEKFFIRAVS